MLSCVEHEIFITSGLFKSYERDKEISINFQIIPLLRLSDLLSEVSIPQMNIVSPFPI